MELSNPAYLWALWGLLIPLAIHLLSRKAGRVVQVGSIRHLTESSTRRFKSIRFNEYLLFVLRALAVVLFVLLLTGLTVPGSESRQKWLLIEGNPRDLPGLEQRLDSLRQAGYEWRSFSHGFPPVEETDSLPVTNYPRLLQQLAALPVDAVVLARNRLEAFRGRQLALPANVDWLQVPAADPKEEALWAMRLHPDTVQLLRGRTGPDRTAFTRIKIHQPQPGDTIADPVSGKRVSVATDAPIRVLLYRGTEAGRSGALLTAALRAVEAVSGRTILIEQVAEITGNEVPASDVDLIIDLRSEGKRVTKDAVRLITSGKTQNGKLLEQTGRYSWRLDPDLDRQRMLQEAFPVALSRILLRDRDLEDQLRAWDQRSVDEDVFFVDGETVMQTAGTTRVAIDQWLLMLLVVTLMVERIIAFYRKA